MQSESLTYFRCELRAADDICAPQGGGALQRPRRGRGGGQRSRAERDTAGGAPYIFSIYSIRSISTVSISVPYLKYLQYLHRCGAGGRCWGRCCGAGARCTRPALCSTGDHSTAQYSTVQHSTVLQAAARAAPGGRHVRGGAGDGGGRGCGRVVHRGPGSGQHTAVATLSSLSR